MRRPVESMIAFLPSRRASLAVSSDFWYQLESTPKKARRNAVYLKLTKTVWVALRIPTNFDMQSPKFAKVGLQAFHKLVVSLSRRKTT